MTDAQTDPFALAAEAAGVGLPRQRERAAGDGGGQHATTLHWIENTGTIGLERSLRIFREVERMARESVEGQALELGWVRENDCAIGIEDYAIAFAFPPCTHFAVSGARWFREKGLPALIEGLTLVEACRRILDWLKRRRIRAVIPTKSNQTRESLHPSSIQTILSAPEFHRIGLTRHRGAGRGSRAGW